MSDTADILYGATTPGAQREDQGSTGHSAAEVLYGSKPEPKPDTGAPRAVQAERAADDARALYSAQSTFQAALPDGAIEGLDHAAAREVLADLGASPDDAAALVALHNGTDDGSTWQDESRAWLRENAIESALWAKAQALAERDPRVASYLEATGLGSHPRVVEFFCESSPEARAYKRPRFIDTTAPGNMPHDDDEEELFESRGQSEQDEFDLIRDLLPASQEIERALDQLQFIGGEASPRRNAYDAVAVTPNDGADLPAYTHALCVGLQVTGSGGNINVDLASGGTTVLTGLVTGQIVDVAVKRVRATSTTATGIVALYDPLI